LHGLEPGKRKAILNPKSTIKIKNKGTEFQRDAVFGCI
jgi:hypothetical protein